jgi:hypothetical protein
MAGGEHGVVLAGVALRRGDVADAAMAVLVVVPAHERGRPLPCFGQVGKARAREVGTVLGGAEQRLGIGIANLRLADVAAFGTGVRVEKGTFTGDIDIRGVRAGVPPSGASRGG